MADAARRREVLVGVLLGIGLTGAVAFVSAKLRPSGGRPAAEGASEFPHHSYAQQGEDLIVQQMFDMLHLHPTSYLDIGAHHPVESNNTYLFYTEGWRGVLVEPNPYYVAMLRAQRPGDVVLGVGIGPHDEKSSDYYEIDGDGQRNTFSHEQVEALQKAWGENPVVKVIKMPLVNINEVIDQYFPDGGPGFLSVDTEGLDLDILRSLDFNRHRPPVICAETLVIESDRLDPAIGDFLTSKGYTARGETMVNTVFVANEWLSPSLPDGGAARRADGGS